MDLPGGGAFYVRSAWRDLYKAICNAKHLIYITGWSIYDKITLVRDASKPMQPSKYLTLGAAHVSRSSISCLIFSILTTLRRDADAVDWCSVHSFILQSTRRPRPLLLHSFRHARPSGMHLAKLQLAKRHTGYVAPG